MQLIQEYYTGQLFFIFLYFFPCFPSWIFSTLSLQINHIFKKIQEREFFTLFFWIINNTRVFYKRRLQYINKRVEEEANRVTDNNIDYIIEIYTDILF